MMSYAITKKTSRGVALADLLACAALLVLAAAVGVPTLALAREASKRMACSVNLKGIGLAGAAYAEGYNGQWMLPPFRGPGTEYLCHGNDSSDYMCVGFDRERQSTSPTPAAPAGGSMSLSITRAYWMLVRSGDVSAKQLICPSSVSDEADSTEMIQLYYDFQEYKNISYGYLVPFGPVATRPQQGRDSRVVFAADKGPFYSGSFYPDFETSGPNDGPVELNHAPRYWQRFNSPNHGEKGASDGQNALFADGRVEFHRIPAFGADQDNIYTVMLDAWGVWPFGRTYGDSPHNFYVPNPYPGQEAFGQGTSTYSTTDSLIYP